jgi:putative hydroxymethylpyrimidine transporter CytX
MAVDYESTRTIPDAEAPATLYEPAPRTLGLFDQLGFWGNVGVSLLGFSGAIAVLAPYGVPQLSFVAAVAATVVGSVLGGLILGASLVLGARTGAPAMVLLRGLVGGRASVLPTALNIAQCLGWAIFELVVISTGLAALSHGHLPRWLCIVAAGIVTTALTIRPLGWIRTLRKYVSVLVVLALVVLAVGLLHRHGDHLTGSWKGFWLAVDSAMALTISWVPLGADYSRHSRTSGAAFAGGFLGYGITQVACLVIGLVALSQLGEDGSGIFDLFIGLPLGAIAFAVLVIRETDQSFANVYSTAISLQNLRPGWDRRLLSLAIGALTTVLALSINISDYANFLYLIGAVFIPLSGALIATWLRTGRDGWDVSFDAPVRPAMLAAWLVGFVVYQVINPGSISYWSDFWTRVGTDLHTLGHPWLSASIASFAVAVLLALPFTRTRAGTERVAGVPADGRPEARR